MCLQARLQATKSVEKNADELDALMVVFAFCLPLVV